MDLILYITMFIMGTVLGSFFTLAVYRIPLKKDITHERSFCPNCNHRLEFFDLIPILSYLFLGGKCRYCKQKIRPRYLLLEVLSGIIFMLFYISLKIDILNIDINKLAYFIFGMFYISTLFIIAGIEKEKHFIPKSLLLFGLIISLLYIIYLYIIHVSIYKYVIYSILMLLFVILNKKQNYSLQILALIMFILIGTNEEISALGIIVTLIAIALEKFFKSKNNKKNIPIGFYLCITNVLLLLLQNFILK